MVAKQEGVAPQTIHDGCCRRLPPTGSPITDFDVQVQKRLNGNPKFLHDQLVGKANPGCHTEIQQFFRGAGVQAGRNETGDEFRQSDKLETFSVDLPRAEALRLRLLCTVAGKSPSNLIFEIVTTNVERQLEPLLAEILKDPKRPYKQLRK